MSLENKKATVENPKALAKALREEFAPRVREMCADDDFDCDDLCAGNLMTAQCIVLRAADCIIAQEAENAELRAKNADLQRRFDKVNDFEKSQCAIMLKKCTAKDAEITALKALLLEDTHERKNSKKE